MRTIAYILISLICINAFAVVDMRRANFAQSWVDLKLDGAGFDLTIRRNYDSRSTHNGIHGYGWCSEFESSVAATPEGAVKLVECGDGKRTLFTPNAAEYNKNLSEAVAKIASELEKQGKFKGQEAQLRLRERLARDSEFRTGWAKIAGVTIPKVPLGKPMSATGTLDKLTFDGSGYTVVNPRGSARKYNKEGELVSLQDRNGNWLKFDRSGAKILSITDNLGRKLTFSYSGANSKVQEIRAPNGLVVTYKYNGDLLVSAVNSKKETYTYEYDKSKNLTRIVNPDKTYASLRYNTEKDWVTAFDRNGECTENYDYELGLKNGTEVFSASLERKCKNQPVNKESYRFAYRTAPAGGRQLASIDAQSKENRSHVEYAANGLPKGSLNDGRKTDIEYYPNGLVKSRSTPYFRNSFQYDPKTSRVSKVDTVYMDGRKRVTSKKWTKFQYDGRGNVTVAETSHGQKVSVAYDLHGRMTSIQAKGEPRVSLQYDEQLGKPTRIAQEKVGVLNLTYDANGNLKSKTSAQGARVAEKVSVSFNMLQNLIQTATNSASF